MLNLAAATRAELAEYIEHLTQPRHAQEAAALAQRARQLRHEHYGDAVFLRALVECTGHCMQNCLYCGLRRGNQRAQRFRLSKGEILASCARAHALRFRSFVLQGGEDPRYDDTFLCAVVEQIKNSYPACSLTLSFGERPRASYAALRKAGADRYLLRHETANPQHYARLHPPAQTLQNRKRCLFDLKDLGFQTGAGFMVGSPGQTPHTLADDLLFLRELGPHMVGIGPFLPHVDTPLHACPPGALPQVLVMLSLVRLLLPGVLLPATTALASMHPTGRMLGLLAGANVVMPNVSPPFAREKYQLYNGKLATGAESGEGLRSLCEEIERAGMHPSFTRGDHVCNTPL